jgi:hypothetical protein
VSNPQEVQVLSIAPSLRLKIEIFVGRRLSSLAEIRLPGTRLFAIARYPVTTQASSGRHVPFGRLTTRVLGNKYGDGGLDVAAIKCRIRGK